MRSGLVIWTAVCVACAILQAQNPAAQPRFTAKQAELGKKLNAKRLELEKEIPRQDWAAPAEPFKIMGNLYFVGPRYGESFLLTSPQGHILIGAAMEKASEVVKRNIESLGFKMTDIKVILLNHNHEDQSGGAAYLKAKTGAQVMAGFGEIPYLEHGTFDRPARLVALSGEAGGAQEAASPRRYPPVKVDRALFDGDVVRVGPLRVTVYLIPGHSPTPATFSFTVRDGGRDYKVVDHCCWWSPDDLNGVGYITEATARHSFETFHRLYPVDIYLPSPASSWSGTLNQPSGTLAERIAKLRRDNKLWVNREIYNEFIAAHEVEFQESLAKSRRSNP